MAAGSPGTPSNARPGFTPDDASVATIGGTSKGFIEGDIDVSVDRQYNFVELDQVRVKLAGICIRKDMMASFGMGEILLGNHQHAWDNDAAAGSVLTIDDDMGGVVALLLNTTPPGYDGSDTRVVSMPTAPPVSGGVYSIRQSDKQSIGAVTFQAIGSSAQLLGTITDAYA